MAEKLDDKTAAHSALETHAQDWANEETAIKAICEAHGVITDDGSGYFKPAVECVEELSGKLTASLSERDRLKQLVGDEWDGVAADKLLTDVEQLRAQLLDSQARESALRTALERVRGESQECLRSHSHRADTYAHHCDYRSHVQSNMDVAREALATPADNGLFETVVDDYEESIAHFERLGKNDAAAANLANHLKVSLISITGKQP